MRLLFQLITSRQKAVFDPSYHLDATWSHRHHRYAVHPLILSWSSSLPNFYILHLACKTVKEFEAIMGISRARQRTGQILKPHKGPSLHLLPTVLQIAISANYSRAGNKKCLKNMPGKERASTPHGSSRSCAGTLNYSGSQWVDRMWTRWNS